MTVFTIMILGIIILAGAFLSGVFLGEFLSKMDSENGK